MRGLTPPPARRLRVALFSGNFNYTRDGSNQALNRLVAHLETTCGYEVRVYSPTVREPAFAPAGDVVPAPSISIPTRPDYRLALGLTPSMRADLVRFAPDIVHLSTPDLLGWQALGVARTLGAPVVASVHTRFETYLRYYGLGWLRPVADAYLRAFYRRCDYVLVPNRAMAGEMSAAGLGGRIRLWSRGVDADLFNPRRRDVAWRHRHGFGDDDVVVLFFGRVVKEKGLATFADTLDRAAAHDPRIRALVIGAGPAQRWFARRLPTAVHTGELYDAELGRAVASADIMFNPSLTEAFGNVTLEAMAAGLPMVCADAPAHRALVTPATGLLRPMDDVEAYAEAIVELARHPARRWAFGAAARRESLRYSWPAVLGGVADVYAEALSAKRRELDPGQCATRADKVAWEAHSPVMPREVRWCRPAAGRRRS